MKKYKCSKYTYILYLCSAQFVSFFFVQRFKSTLRPSLQKSDMNKIICILGSLRKLAPICIKANHPDVFMIIDHFLSKIGHTELLDIVIESHRLGGEDSQAGGESEKSHIYLFPIYIVIFENGSRIGR